MCNGVENYLDNSKCKRIYIKTISYFSKIENTK